MKAEFEGRVANIKHSWGSAANVSQDRAVILTHVETGVQYLIFSGGIAILVDRDGRPLAG